MQLMPRLFIGGHRELRRPANTVDESLMARIEEARHRLQIEGKDIKPVRTVAHRSRPQPPYGAQRRVVALRPMRAVEGGTAAGRTS